MPDVSKTKSSLSLKAPAKLNLGLEVVRKRPDGFHDIRTIFQAIHLYDFLTLSPNSSGAIELQVTGSVSVDAKLEDNLVMRAALRLQSLAPDRGVSITLDKHIPVGAGLGGGSSDAAATLVGLNELWGLELSKTTLAALALELGSDVPFFLEGGTAMGEGQGEQLTPFDGPPSWSWLLVIPSFSISTESAYLKARIGLTQSRQRLNMAQLALKSQDLAAFVDHWINDLEPGVWGSEPRLGEIAAAMESCGLPLAAMTGSGSVLFSIDSAGLSGEPVSDQAVSALKSREGIKDVLRCSSVSTGVLKT